MIVRCLHCGEDMECSNGLERGQNVRCPSCGGKFAYDGGPKADKGIEAADVRLAVDACLRNPDDKRFYEEAPEGSRTFIELVFYGKIFKDRLTADAYLAAFSAVEAEMSAKDFLYLASHV